MRIRAEVHIIWRKQKWNSPLLVASRFRGGTNIILLTPMRTYNVVFSSPPPRETRRYEEKFRVALLTVLVAAACLLPAFTGKDEPRTPVSTLSFLVVALAPVVLDAMDLYIYVHPNLGQKHWRYYYKWGGKSKFRWIINYLILFVTWYIWWMYGGCDQRVCIYTSSTTTGSTAVSNQKEPSCYQNRYNLATMTIFIGRYTELQYLQAEQILAILQGVYFFFKRQKST